MALFTEKIDATDLNNKTKRTKKTQTTKRNSLSSCLLYPLDHFRPLSLRLEVLPVDIELLQDRKHCGDTPVQGHRSGETDRKESDHERKSVEHHPLLDLRLAQGGIFLPLLVRRSLGGGGLLFLAIVDREGKFHLPELECDEQNRHDIDVRQEKIHPQELRAETPRQMLVRRVEKVFGERQNGPVTNGIEEPDEDRELHEERQAGLHRVYFVLFPDLHCFLLHLLRIIFVLCFQGIHLRLHGLHLALSFHGVLRGDEEQQFDDDCKQDDRDAEVVVRRIGRDEDKSVEQRLCNERAEELRHDARLIDRKPRDDSFAVLAFGTGRTDLRALGNGQFRLVDAVLVKQRVLPGSEVQR